MITAGAQKIVAVIVILLVIGGAAAFRGAGIGIVWPQLLATAAIGVIAFVAALARFRRTVTLSR